MTAAERRLRVAIIGAGLMGYWHAVSAQRANGDIVAAVDPDLRRSRALAARFKGAKASDDPATAMTGQGVDIIHVCTPAYHHAGLARLALESGAHVIVEKPLAPTRSITAELVCLARERGRLLCPVHQFLFQPGVMQVVEHRHSFGPIVHLEIMICSAGASGQSDDERDRIAMEILPHPLSLVGRMLPQQLARAQWAVQRSRAGEIRISGIAGEATVSIIISMSGRPTVNSLRLIGERASAHADLFHGFQVTEGGAVSRAHKATRPLTLSAMTFSAALTNLARRAAEGERAYPGLFELVHRFYGAVRCGAAPPISEDEILAVAGASDTLHSLAQAAGLHAPPHAAAAAARG